MGLRCNMAKPFLCSFGVEEEGHKLWDKVENVPQGSQSSALFACPGLSSPQWAALQRLPACVSLIEYLFANISAILGTRNTTKKKKKNLLKIPALVELHSNNQNTRDVSW